MARLRHGLLIGHIERETWKELRASGGYGIHTKPRLTDVVDDQDAAWNSVHKQFMRTAHFDFIVTDDSPNAKPLVAIEIDGPSHEAEEQKRRDTLKDEICRLARLPLWRFGPLGLPSDLIPVWIRHVYEVWKEDRAIEESGGERHPPLWEALEQVKNCLTRIQHKTLTIQVKSNDLLECPVGPHIEGYAKITVSVDGKITSAEAVTRGVPASPRVLCLLATELAEYKAMHQLGVWHSG